MLWFAGEVDRCTAACFGEAYSSTDDIFGWMVPALD